MLFENLKCVDGLFIILNGNFVFDGVVVKVLGVKVCCYVGLVKVFDLEEDVIQVVLIDEIVDGDVVVVCFVGFKGGFGMFEMLLFLLMIVGKG